MQVANFPKLSMEEVSLNNVLLGMRRLMPFEYEGRKGIFRFVEKFKRKLVLQLYLKLRLSDYYVWVGLNQVPVSSLLKRDLVGIELQNFPNEVKQVLLESLWSPILAYIESRIGVYAELVELRLEKPQEMLPKKEVFFECSFDGTHNQLCGILFLEFAVVELLTALVERVPYVRRLEYRSIPIPLNIILHEFMLPFAEYQQIEANDILLWNSFDTVRKGRCRVVFGYQLQFSGEWNSNTVTLIKKMDRFKHFMAKEGDDDSEDFDISEYLKDLSEDDDQDSEEEDDDDEEEEDEVVNWDDEDGEEDDEGEDEEEDEDQEEDEEDSDQENESFEEDDEEEVDAPQDIAMVAKPEPRSVKVNQEGSSLDVKELPIRILFELGQKELLLDELQGLREGFTFELENPLESPVIIRANGKVIGIGEILDLGGRVGVRIKHLK